MEIEDRTQDALPWLAEADGPRRLQAYVAYQQACAPWSVAVWEMSGHEWPRMEEVRDRVAAPQPGLVSCIEDRRPLRCAERAAEQFAELTALQPARIVLLVGCCGSNAVQALSPDGPAAILCAEHLAPAEQGLGLSIELGMGWLVHELAHCARYAIPGSCSPVAAFPRQSSGFRDRLDALPALERLIDEGIAAALQLGATGAMHPAQALHFGEQEHRDILAMGPRLLSGHDLRAPAGGASAMLYLTDPKDGIPGRWGYVVGAEIARRALGSGLDWPALLAASAADVLLAAADSSDREWKRALQDVHATACG